MIVGWLTHAGVSDVLIQRGIVNSTMSSKMQDLEDCIKFLTDKTIFLQKSLEKSCQQVDQLDLRVKTVEGIQCRLSYNWGIQTIDNRMYSESKEEGNKVNAYYTAKMDIFGST